MSISLPHGGALSAADIEARLTDLAPTLVSGGSRALDLRRLTGGASLETWAFDVEGEGGVAPLILRRRQAVEESVFETSLSLQTEAWVLDAAGRASVPVAGLARICTDEDGLGEAYVVQRVAGETLGRRIAAAPEFASARGVLGRQCGATLARIHGLDAAGLPPLETMDAAAVIDRYVEIYRKGQAKRPVIEAAIRWMRERIPAPVPARPLHGDFRNGNLMIDPATGLVAVLDWELAHLGDPAEDLGWLCVNSWRFGVIEKAVGGFADLDDLLAGYRAAGGEPPPVERIRFWQAVGSFKWAVVALMMYRSFCTGESVAVERAVIGRRISECEVDLLALMEAGR